MLKIIFKIFFGLNIIWGILFGLRVFAKIHQVRNDEGYNCGVSYNDFSNDDTYPSVFRSKKLAFYLIFSFFNPSDTPNYSTRFATQSDFECPNKNSWNDWGQLLSMFLLFYLWIATLALSIKYNYLVIIPTSLSIISIVWISNYILNVIS